MIDRAKKIETSVRLIIATDDWKQFSKAISKSPYLTRLYETLYDINVMYIGWNFRTWNNSWEQELDTLKQALGEIENTWRLSISRSNSNIEIITNHPNDKSFPQIETIEIANDWKTERNLAKYDFDIPQEKPRKPQIFTGNNGKEYRIEHHEMKYDIYEVGSDFERKGHPVSENKPDGSATLEIYSKLIDPTSGKEMWASEGIIVLVDGVDVKKELKDKFGIERR